MTEVVAKFRTLDGPARTAERVLLLAMTVVGGLWATQVHIVPFVFVFHPALIGKGTWAEIAGSVLTAVAGVILLSIGCAGFFTRPLGWPRRAWTFAAAAFFIMPPLAALPALAADAIGAVLTAAFIASELTAIRPLARARPVEKPS